MDGTRGNKEVLKLARKERSVTQIELAKQLGMLQGGLSSVMSRPRMSLGMFVKILNALDYDVAVIDRQTGELKWTLNDSE